MLNTDMKWYTYILILPTQSDLVHLPGGAVMLAYINRCNYLLFPLSISNKQDAVLDMFLNIRISL